MIGNKIAEENVKVKPVPDENLGNKGKIEQKRYTKRIKTSTKNEHQKISKLLNDLTASNFKTKKWIEVNDLSNGQYYVNMNIKDQVWLTMK